MQTVIVAGGAGFIGSHLCEQLLQKNYKVICIDNFITGDRKNIEKLLQNKSFEFIEHDITTTVSPFLFQLESIDFIFHLASPASPNKNSKRSYINYPIETLRVNSQGTYNLLQVAQERNARFLYVSSSEIYGDPAISPQPEEYFGNVNPIGVRSVYDEGKRFGEALTMAYFRKFSINTRIVRIFNTYGPQMQVDDGRVISNFITQAIRHKPLTIYGKGDQTRSFCFVDDMVEGLQKVMFTEKMEGQIFNLGNPDERTVGELAEIVKKMTNSSSEITFEELPEDDPKIRKPDITKAKEKLNWEPKVSLDEGLKRTIEYFSNV